MSAIETTFTINNTEVVLSNKEQKTFCTSLDVAKVFNKSHRHILRDIVALSKIGLSLESAQYRDFFNANFELTSRDVEVQGAEKMRKSTRKYKVYNLTRDGFSILAMGFTGKEALQWKIAFIEAFNKMEQAIRQAQAKSIQQDNSIQNILNLQYETPCRNIVLKEVRRMEETNNIIVTRINEYCVTETMQRNGYKINTKVDLVCDTVKIPKITGGKNVKKSSNKRQSNIASSQ